MMLMLRLFAVGLPVLVAVMFPAVAQSVAALDASNTSLPNDSVPVLPEPEPLVVPDETAELTRYSDGRMAIDYPSAWQIEVLEDSVSLANVTEVAVERVATEIFRIAAPPAPVVNANIDSFLEEGTAVGRYRAVTIDQQDALVMWLAERPDDLSAAIATFIGYGDETILLFSRYDPTNDIAEDDILRLHTSFVNLAVEPDADSLMEEPDPESVDDSADVTSSGNN